jgi:IS30 family transposase
MTRHQEQEQYLISLRREKVQSLLACNRSITSISHELNVPSSTVSDDKQFLRKQARENIRNYADVYFPEQYQQLIDLISEVLYETWTTARNVKYERHKTALLSLTKDLVMAKASLLCDVSLVDRTASYVEQLRKS